MRMLCKNFLSAVVVFACIIVSANEANPAAAQVEAASALSDYVNRPDASYAWKVRRRGTSGTRQYAELIRTSQTWHGIIWKHQLFVYRPADSKDTTQALLLIDEIGRAHV